MLAIDRSLFTLPTANTAHVSVPANSARCALSQTLSHHHKHTLSCHSVGMVALQDDFLKLLACPADAVTVVRREQRLPEPHRLSAPLAPPASPTLPTGHALVRVPCRAAPPPRLDELEPAGVDIAKLLEASASADEPEGARRATALATHWYA